jgi:hypothetical protein
MNAIKGLGIGIGVMCLCMALGTSIGLITRAKPLPKPNARAAGVVVGKSSGRFIRGFIQGVKESAKTERQ